MRKAKRTIIIAEQTPLLRIGIRHTLEECDWLHIIGEAADGEQAIKKTYRLKPDILLLSDDLPLFHSREIIHQLYLLKSTTRVLLIGNAKRSERRAAFRLGAYGYLARDIDPAELIDALRHIANGERIASEGIYISPAVRPAVSQQPLSVRELEVLKCITQGMTNQAIAEHLYISEKTVKNHLTRIFRKMNVTDRTQAALAAIKQNRIVLE
ncbi:MAG: response regulator transcription factor [Selenomonadales bacterium]|nr:response regulator transcription factor [Selenomonadales bacterium]